MAITTLNLRALNRSDTASSGQVVTATSATAADFQAAGGKVLQYAYTEDLTSSSTTSTTLATSGTSVVLGSTLASSSAKVRIRVSFTYAVDTSRDCKFSLYDGSALLNPTGMEALAFANTNGGGGSAGKYMHFEFQDTVSSTTPKTYTLYMCSNTSAAIYIGRSYNDGVQVPTIMIAEELAV